MGETRLQTLLKTTGAALSDNSPAHLFFPFKASRNDRYQVWPVRKFELIKAKRESICEPIDLTGRMKDQSPKIIDRLHTSEQQQGRR